MPDVSIDRTLSRENEQIRRAGVAYKEVSHIG